MQCNQALLHCACVVDCDLRTKLCEDGDGVLSIFAVKDRDCQWSHLSLFAIDYLATSTTIGTYVFPETLRTLRTVHVGSYRWGLGQRR